MARIVDVLYLWSEYKKQSKETKETRSEP